MEHNHVLGSATSGNPCPACGTCPHCGRGPAVPAVPLWPGYPRPYVGDWPPIAPTPAIYVQNVQSYS